MKFDHVISNGKITNKILRRSALNRSLHKHTYANTSSKRFTGVSLTIS